ncbi:MAG: amidohydrolase family protein [Armatimonadetes bacterium]|nr:amidohydrolase family protein [Armatimonadota bacterium]
MRIVNATIMTGDASRPVVHELAVVNGRVVDWSDGPLLDLKGAFVMPGFNDAHVHVWKVGHLLTSLIDLRAVTDISELQAALRDAQGDGWVLGRGFNEAHMRERRMPTRADLDAAVADRPVMLTRTCGHIAVANSRALAMAGVAANSDAPPGGAIRRDPSGEPSGVLEETAMGLVSKHVPPPTAAEYERMILAAARRHLGLGITSATEAGVTPDILAAYRDLEARGLLPYRVNVLAMRRPLGSDEVFPLPEKFVSDFLRVDTVKLIVDGGLSGATAALRQPYRHAAERGVLRMETDEIVALFEEPARMGYRLAAHAIGDAAIEVLLDAYERLKPTAPRIEHFGLPDARQIERAQAMGAIAVPQAVFLPALGANFRAYLPDVLLDRAYPLRDMITAGMIVALSSDAPVVADENPLIGIQAAVTRGDHEGRKIAADQWISMGEAFRSYTWCGAVASGDQDNRGRLMEGKWADFLVLDQDPRDVKPENLHKIKVMKTFVGGVLAYEA